MTRDFSSAERAALNHTDQIKDFKRRALRGGLAKMAAVAANFVLRIASLMVLARLLDPTDFGLVGMVTALTGMLNLFRDFGLSTATVQQSSVTQSQASSLFWLNLLIGLTLSIITVAAAPGISAFNRDPRLAPVAVGLAFGFLFNAAGVQHLAFLRRQMRFTTTAGLEMVGFLVSAAIGVGMAYLGYGYWSLVLMNVTPPLVMTVGAWVSSGWVPSWPQWGSNLRAMVQFGGTVTLNGMVVYVAYNLEKVLLGRFWGPEAVGIYGRAFQLISIPTDNLNSTVGEVTFSALSRLQEDPVRLRSYFLKGYSSVLALTVPITIACALFATEITTVLLGPKWHASATIFRLLAPTIVVFALINPLAWLLFSVGLVGRSLKVALVLSPLVIAGYVAGLPYGPEGVAFGYSAVLILWVGPHIAWCVQGTVVSLRDIIVTASRPLAAGALAAGITLAVLVAYGGAMSPALRLILGGGLLLTVYTWTLLFALGQRAVLVGLLAAVKGRVSDGE